KRVGNKRNEQADECHHVPQEKEKRARVEVEWRIQRRMHPWTLTTASPLKNCPRDPAHQIRQRKVDCADMADQCFRERTEYSIALVGRPSGSGCEGDAGV